MSIEQSVIHTAVGYLIVEENDALIQKNEYRRKVGDYFGVDRQPPFITPDEQIRAAEGIPFVTDKRLHKALDEWFAMVDTGTPFISNRQVAINLLATFREFGHKLELLFCEHASSETSSGTEDVQSPNCTQGAIAETYGYDVSWPSCNHSAILQPGLVSESSIWRSRLNNWGLLPDFFTVCMLREEYLKVYPYPPFEIYRVHRARE